MNRLAAIAVVWFVAYGHTYAQQAFDLDPSFRATFNDWSVTSIVPLDDRRVLLSGRVRYNVSDPFATMVRLLPNGQRDLTYNENGYGGGKITPWSGRFYVAGNLTVRRLWPDGTNDTGFPVGTAMIPYFIPLQGGDCHVYPDGRILMGGVHQVNYPDSNWVGFYNLIWFSNEGYLDTTRAPHGGDGAINRFKELPDGKFICSGAMSQFDGHATSNIFRVRADGALDTTFTTGTIWGGAYCFIPLPDGRCYVGGRFKSTMSTDTLQVVRLMPDGSLDPTFHNTLRFGIAPPQVNPWNLGGVESITPLDDGRLIVTGLFDDVDGNQRGGICLVDTNGTLLSEHFSSGGCGPHTYGGTTVAAIAGIHFLADSMCYIWGEYHGYDDGTTNDTLQRFVTRLYGPDFSTGVAQRVGTLAKLSVYPNPSTGQATVALDALPLGAYLVVRDAMGRTVHTQRVTDHYTTLALEHAGLYLVELRGADGSLLKSEKLIVRP